MNIEKILEYQEKDYEIFKLERDLYDGEDRKNINEMIQKIKDSQSKSLQLEQRAGELNVEFENLKNSFDVNMSKLNMMLKSNYTKLGQSDLESFETNLNNLINNLTLIENKLSNCAKLINIILSNFETAKKNYNISRSQYSKFRQSYEEKEKVIKPKIEALSKGLADLEKNIDDKILQRYKSKRQDRRFPIFVNLLDNKCGGCQIELSYAILNKLNDNPIIECEHCRRLIYTKK